MMQLQWNQPLLSTTIPIRVRSKAKGGVMGNYELQIINYKLSITNYQLQIINYTLPITNYTLTITNYTLTITN